MACFDTPQTDFFYAIILGMLVLLSFFTFKVVYRL
jgi:hypothetical protein